MSNNTDKHNTGGMIAFIFSISFCLIFFIYIAFIHPGVDLKEVTEVAPAEAGPVFDMSKVAKPWEENKDVIAYGKKVYGSNCAVCHGAEGKGDGAAGAGLNPKPRNFVEGKWRYGGDSLTLFHTVANGSPGTSMAPFKHLPKNDRWAVVQYIRSITTNKTKDDPAALDKNGPTAE